MTRVLHVIPQLGTGGAGRVALDLLRHAPGQGLQARLCVLYGPEEACGEGLAPGRIGFLGGRPGFTSPANLTALGRGLRRLCEELRPDIVHSHLRPADMVVAGALAGARLTHVSHQHDTTASLAGQGWRPGLKRQLARRLYRRMGTRFIFVSRAVEAYFAEAFGDWDYHSRVIHNGADERRFFMESPPGRRAGGETVFGTAARLAPEKGIDTLLGAFAALRARVDAPVRLRIAGTGRCDAELRALAADLGLADAVAFLGHVRDMRGFYNDIDTFVLASRHSEGFPLSIVEAMFCGRPVIATDVAGAREAVAEGRNGFLVPVDEPEGLAQAMAAVMQREMLLQLAHQAEQDAKARFGLKGALQRVSAFYRASLDSARSGARVAAAV